MFPSSLKESLQSGVVPEKQGFPLLLCYAICSSAPLSFPRHGNYILLNLKDNLVSTCTYGGTSRYIPMRGQFMTDLWYQRGYTLPGVAHLPGSTHGEFNGRGVHNA